MSSPNWILVVLLLFGLFLVSYALSRFFARVAIKIAFNIGALAHPTPRSSHTAPTPRIGGIGLVIPFLLLALAFHFAVWLAFSRQLQPLLSSTPIELSPFGLSYFAYGRAFWLVLLLGGGGMFLVGLLDDLRGLKPWQKLALQSVFAAVAPILGFGLTTLWVPVLGNLELGVVGMFLAFFWILFAMNAYNFMDGMDGIAGSFAIYVAVFLLLIYETSLPFKTELAPLAILLIGCSAGFLAYNRSPAKTFMGDCGSQFLGYFFALIALKLNRYDPRAFLVVLLLMLPFLYDVTFTLIRRAIQGKNLLKAHHNHLYQRLLELGFSHKNVLEILEVTFILCGLAVYFYCKVPQQSLQGLFAALAFVVMILYTVFVVWQERRIAET